VDYIEEKKNGYCLPVTLLGRLFDNLTGKKKDRQIFERLICRRLAVGCKMQFV
jgi:hypothetical protein